MNKLIEELNSLFVVIQRISNNPRNNEETKSLAKEAMDAVRQTTDELSDEGMEQEATNRLLRITSSIQLFEDNERKV